jgi:hypothetical protein
MANKITNLRNWINGEVFNARDYVYERNLIVALVNSHEDRVTNLETFRDNLDIQFDSLGDRITVLENAPGPIGQNIFVQDTEPTGLFVGDLWYDTN